LTTVPVASVIGGDYPPLRWLVSVDDGETVHPPHTIARSIDPKQLILTFDGLLQRGGFAIVKNGFNRLQEQYNGPSI
jgi:hypothetical protein